MHVRKRILGAAVSAALVALALMGAPAGAGKTAGAGETMVKIDNFTFGPQRLTVQAGTTVTWINQDDIPHTIVSTTLAFRSKALDTDDKYSFTFTAPGNYDYFCSLHPHMTGTIVVEAAGKGGPAP
jgi:plastocyanin